MNQLMSILQILFNDRKSPSSLDVLYEKFEPDLSPFVFIRFKQRLFLTSWVITSKPIILMGLEKQEKGLDQIM